MLSGNLSGKILKFAIPLAATGILQQLFNAADIAVIGRYVGENAMAAVGSNSPLTALIINLFTGISIGANVVIARFIGMGRKKDVRRTVHTSLLVAVVSGVIFGAVCELLSRPILSLLSIPDSVFEMALLYFRIYIMGLPVILLYDFASAIFRSRGNTRTPLLCLTVSGVVNVILNLFFVLVLKMTVNGVALATVIANLISSALLVFFLVREKSEIKVHLRALRVDFKILKEMVKIGLPAGVQGMVFSFSNLIIQSSINKLGANVMAGSAAAFNIEIFAYYVINSFGQACTTFTGQNYGAGKPSRCRRVLMLSLVMDMVATVAMSIGILIFGKQLLAIFNGDPAIIETGMIRLKYILTMEFVNVLIEVLSGFMRGFGYSFVPALICTFGICGVRIGWIYTVFPHHQTFPTLMTAYALSWAVTALAMIAAYQFMKRTHLRSFFSKSQ